MENKIVPFDENFYKKLKNTYVSSLPVYFHIKYLRPMEKSPGNCLERSLYMFFCFDDALLVRGENKELELYYGKDSAFHGWIEIDNYVYDPTTLIRYDKDLYYKIYKIKNVQKCTLEEYLQDDNNKQFYYSIKQTTIDDFKINGKKRFDLLMAVPLISALALNSNNQEFINDLNNYLELIEYNEGKIYTTFEEELAKLNLKP